MILDDIAAKKIIRVNKRKEKISIEEIRNRAYQKCETKNRENAFMKNLKSEGFSIIGEFKKASPSKGIITEVFDIEKIHSFYKKLNINTFSVLTEEDFFLGSDEYLKKVKEYSDCAVLRKDFIIDMYQIYEAKVLNADAVLLIASLLKDNLSKYYEEAKKFNLEALVEVHNKEELDMAINIGANIIGINNRNLKTFKTSLDITKDLIDIIPKDRIKIAESGIMSNSDMLSMKKLGADGCLVGEYFMRNIENDDFSKTFNAFRDENL
ncbi:indole-3-glycerol phosphate synthase TrpC [Clostridium sp. BJN0001]|uniref:indole-3-glycerol phosphate synthase TrpC n=1 Tax=Clostridium sp. BJN0001 TaxID=2930219 RepID=UPI001FD424BA|nr:indole-3-glycerol phosphate synthase TrpC [Clostridium sp. BJN0001]